MSSGSKLVAFFLPLVSAQFGYPGLEYGGMSFGGMGLANMGYGGMGYGGGIGYAGVGYAGVGYPGMGLYGNTGGYIPTGFGHGIIQGASTAGAIIRGPSGTIIAAPQSAGSIVF